MHKISIITATYNVQQTILTCLDSLQQQTVPFEHIVIDGLSSDTTLDIIKSQSPDSRIISEKDNGLYDALNKGIQSATGDVVGILHADDFYAATHVLQLVSDVFQDSSVDACYGDLLYVVESERVRGGDSEVDKKEEPISPSNRLSTSLNPSRFTTKRYWRSGPYDPRKFYWGWMPPHPTFFVRKSVYEKYGLFNLGLGTAADYELMLRFLLKHQISCKYIPEVLVNMRVGGVSNASLGNRLRANRNDRVAWRVNGLKPYPWTIPLKPLRKLPQYFLKPKT
jgi:glycosyltransferase involved in cell wall biosynthesis